MSAQQFATLKDEARGNVERIHPMGEQLHQQTMRLFVQPGLDKLALEGEPDTRCGTCAARTGTVPGGCLVTQADLLKAISEDVPFMCHAHEADGEFTHLCHGWFAGRFELDGKKIPAPWPFSDEAIRDEKLRHAKAGSTT